MFAAEYGLLYNINDPAKNERAIRELNLQYLNPMAHADFLECIVNVETTLVAEKIDECLSLSLRADGSVDRTSIDKIYVLINIDVQIQQMSMCIMWNVIVIIVLVI